MLRNARDRFMAGPAADFAAETIEAIAGGHPLWTRDCSQESRSGGTDGLHVAELEALARHPMSEHAQVE
jgi:hypothetical protein